MLAPASGVTNFEAATTGRTNQGDLWNDSSQKGLSAFLAGLQQQINTTIYTATASAGPSNSSAETSIIGTGVGTKTLPAGYLVAGKAVRIRGSGVFNTLSAGNGVLTIRVKLGSTTIASAAFTPTANMTNSPFEYDLRLVCRAAGASGSIIAEGHAELATYNGSTGNGTRNNWDLNALSASVTVDTTISQVVDVTAQFATANASNVFTGATGIVELLN